VYEETHVQRVTTTFAERHPEYWWTDRNGKRRPSKLSFAYPEVREYKLRLIKEQIAYGVDEVCLDFFRENHLFAARHELLIPKQEVDEDGVCIYGYEPTIINTYQEQHGDSPNVLRNSDENWVRFRAGFLTSFMRDVRRELGGSATRLSAKVRSMNLIQAPFPFWEPEAAKILGPRCQRRHAGGRRWGGAL
jgi:hypothetical protein